jgi:membrane-bound ClpP family serine protease
MSWTDWACLGIFIVGFLLFFIGANVYNAIIGYTGVYMFIGAIVAYLVIYIYKQFTKTPTAQNP